MAKMTAEQELERYWKRDSLVIKLQLIQDAINTMQQIYDETESEYNEICD